MDYRDVVLSTRPVFYVPLDGHFIGSASTDNETPELVRGIKGRPTAGAGVQIVTKVPSPVASGEAAGFRNGSASQGLEWPTHTSYHPGDVFSVGGWFNRVGAGGSSNSLLYLGSNDLALRFTSDKINIFKNGVSGPIYQIDTPTFPSPYNAGWQHVIFTKNGSGVASTCTAYLNGVLNTATTYTDKTIVASSTDITIGSGASNTGTATDLCHLAIWNRVLTAGEARMLYEAGRNAV